MKKFLIIATVLVPSIMFTAPVSSQSIEIGPNGIQVNPDGNRRIERERRYEREEISERRASRIARREGMVEVGSISARRDVFIVRGLDRRDNRMSVVIDRSSGEVLEVR